jgi:outer membrane protein OmpA-like peptidoglycan-associated protein
VAAIPNPALDLPDLYRIVFSELNMGSPPEEAGRQRSVFQEALYSARASGRRTVVLVDEAQRLPGDLYRELAAASARGSEGPLFTLVLAGLSGFPQRLEQDAPGAFRPEPDACLRLLPLTEPETRDYIHYRLRACGARDELFDPDALRAIHHVAAGLPRVVNLLCDRALLSGYLAGAERPDAELVRRSAEELGLTPPHPRETPARVVSAPAARGQGLRRYAAGAAAGLAVVSGVWLGSGPFHRPGPPGPAVVEAKLPADATAARGQPTSGWAAPEALPVSRPTGPAATAPEQKRSDDLPRATAEPQPIQAAAPPEPSPVPTADNPTPIAVEPETRPAESRVTGLTAVAPEPLPRPEPALPALPAASMQSSAAAAVPVRTKTPAETPRAFRIAFRPRSAEIDPASYASLRELARAVRSRPGARLTVLAAAEPGSRYMQKLHEFRISAIRSYLAASSGGGEPVRMRAADAPLRPPAKAGESGVVEIRLEY